MTDISQSETRPPEDEDIPRLKAGDRATSFSPLRRLIPFLTRYPVRLSLTFAFLLIDAITSLSLPYLAGDFIDEGLVTANLDVVSSYAWLVIVIAGVIAVSGAARFYLISVIGERAIAD